MSAMAFDSLRYARRLKEAGVPEPQADAQAELMVEAFGFYAANILTRDHFEATLDARFAQLDAKLERGLAEQDAKLEQALAAQDARSDARFKQLDARFVEQTTRFEGRFASLEKTQSLHTWMLGLIVITLVVPQLQAWLVAAALS